MKCFYPVESSSGLRPCGQCAACLVNKHIAWKFRLEKEVLSSDIAFWLTLQYDEEHLPRSPVNGDPYVCKLHCQNFFRKLRKWIQDSDLKVTFKYFLVSEYGPKTHRPHYHALLLFKLPALPFNALLSLRQTLYEQCKARWYHGHCEESLFHSGVVRYLTKYVFKSSDDYVPPVKCFRLISKGIGEDYLNHINKEEVISHQWRTADGVLPRYYRDKLLPSSNSIQGLKNRQIRQSIFFDSIDKVYKKELNSMHKFGSIEAYIKHQEYLLQCQKRLVERKEKQKYG